MSAKTASRKTYAKSIFREKPYDPQHQRLIEVLDEF